jgi:hypothetical protein
MNENPYQATKADLVDVPDAVPARPRAVNIALGLILGAVLIQILVNVYLLKEANFQVAHPWMLGLTFGGFLLYGFLCQQMAQGRGWPRPLLLMFTLVVFVQFCVGLGAGWRFLVSEEMADLLPRFLIVRVIPLAMNLAAMHLLFFSSGSWFRR